MSDRIEVAPVFVPTGPMSLAYCTSDCPAYENFMCSASGQTVQPSYMILCAPFYLNREMVFHRMMFDFMAVLQMFHPKGAVVDLRLIENMARGRHSIEFEFNEKERTKRLWVSDRGPFPGVEQDEAGDQPVELVGQAEGGVREASKEAE